MRVLETSSKGREPKGPSPFLCYAPEEGNKQRKACFSSVFVDLAPMRDIDNKHDKFVAVDVAQNSIVSNPIAPNTREVARKSLSPTFWVFELRDFRKLVLNPTRRLLIHHLKSAKRLLGNLNRPSQASHRLHRDYRSSGGPHGSLQCP